MLPGGRLLPSCRKTKFCVDNISHRADTQVRVHIQVLVLDKKKQADKKCLDYTAENICTQLREIHAFAQVSAKNPVTIRFYDGSTTDTYSNYASEVGEEAVNNSAWNSSKPVMFYVHGLNEGFDSESAVTIADAFLKHGGYNVLTLDYASLAKYTGNIVDAFAHLVTQSGVVGEIMGEMLNRFVAKGVSPSSFYLIGYSIGAHIVGHAARNVNGKIPRITAFDPQLHGWFLFNLTDHLWSTDATSVEVIHSNGLLMGIPTALGTVDFYPNSGYALQPGCSFSLSSDIFFCSSDVSWRWFAESVNNPTAFKSINCASWTEFEAGACSGPTDYMGYGFSQNATGLFYLQTNSASPYSKGDDGIGYDGSKLSILSATILNTLASLFEKFSG